MKKIISLIFALVMLLSFSACSSNSPESGEGTETPTETVVPEKTEEFARGTWDESGKVFTNETTGVKMTVPDSFTVLSDKELAENYLGKDVDISSWTSEDYGKELSIPDCAVISYQTGSNVGVIYENLKMENALSVTEKQYLEVVTEKLGTSDDFVSGEIEDLVLCGNVFKTVQYDYSSNGNQIRQIMAVRKVGNYMTIIVFTERGEFDTLQTMIDFFNK